MAGLCECGCGGRPTPGKRFIQFHHIRTQRLCVEPYRIDAETGCWIWQWSRFPSGYGQLRTQGVDRPLRAHRVYYERAKGPIPEGLQLDHLCRNRGCVNPDHLEPVTNRENALRGAKTKLTPEDVRAIRASDDSARVLAMRYGVAVDYMRAIRSGRRRAADDLPGVAA